MNPSEIEESEAGEREEAETPIPIPTRIPLMTQILIPMRLICET